MGKKKALVAVGHSILVIAYHVVQTRTTYQDLGGAYFERRNGATQRKRLIRQLESLGVKVTVEEIQEAASSHCQYFHSRPITRAMEDIRYGDKATSANRARTQPSTRALHTEGLTLR